MSKLFTTDGKIMLLASVRFAEAADIVSANLIVKALNRAVDLQELVEDAIPILDVLIEDREQAIGEKCEIARDLRRRCKATALAKTPTPEPKS